MGWPAKFHEPELEVNTIRTLAQTYAVAVTLGLLAACQSLPTNNAMVEKARSDYRAAGLDPGIRALAKVEWRQASDAMYEANRAWARNEDTDEIEHMAYMAKQRIAIARETALKVCAEQLAAVKRVDR